MIFFDIDTQRDFMDAAGALAVPDAETIKPNLERLLRVAGEQGITTISSRCAHEAGDPEFEIFPPHCLEGTLGAERVLPDLPTLPRQAVAVDAPPAAVADFSLGTHYVVKKKVFDLFSNAWLESLRVQGRFVGQTCVVFGVATDYCVRCAALGLAQGGAHVLVVQDAVRGVASETTAQTIAEMEAAGVEFTMTDAVLKMLADAA